MTPLYPAPVNSKTISINQPNEHLLYPLTG
jgi:hypothetical protein